MLPVLAAVLCLGLILAPTGISADEKCSGDEVWNQCGSPCTKTCANYKNITCIERCDLKCECPKDRPISHNGRCIRTDQCPTCGTPSVEACQQKCSDIGLVPQPGTECTSCMCESVCKNYDCGQGKRCRSKTVQCVRAPCMPQRECVACEQDVVENCKKNCNNKGLVPVKGTECTECSCQSVCEGHKCEAGKMCREKKVQCAQSPCLPVPECKEKCMGDQVWNDCGSPCTKNCTNYRDIMCAAVCHSKCQCPKDRPIFHNNRCLRTDQCPTCDQMTVEACQKKCSNAGLVPQPGTECTSCMCERVCKDYDCGWDKMCQSKTVQCVRAPCMPQIDCVSCPMEMKDDCKKSCASKGMLPEPGTACNNCRCQSVCKNQKCNAGMMCREQKVQCATAPCPPIPVCDARKCEFGMPLMKGGEEVYCGSGPTMQCPGGYMCSVDPQKRWALCCPVKDDGTGNGLRLASSTVIFHATTMFAVFWILHSW